MKIEGSLPSLEEPAADHYSERDESNPISHYFSKNHLHIILPFMPKYPNWSLSFRFADQNFICSCISYVRRTDSLQSTFEINVLNTNR